MEHSAERFLRPTLCKYLGCTSRWSSEETNRIVFKHCSSPLRPDYIYCQAVHSAPVSEYICCRSTPQHATICCNSSLDMAGFSVLFYRHFLWAVLLQPTREDMEFVHRRRNMLQCESFDGFHRRHKCCLRLCNSIFAHFSHLEASDAQAAKDRRICNFLHWLCVSIPDISFVAAC